MEGRKRNRREGSEPARGDASAFGSKLDELLIPYAYGELDRRDRDRVETELERSPRAREKLRQHLRVAARLSAWADSSTRSVEKAEAESTLRGVRERLLRDRELTVRRRRFVIAAAAVLAFSSSLAFLWLRDPGARLGPVEDSPLASRSVATPMPTGRENVEPAAELLENLELLEELTDVLAESPKSSRELDQQLLDILLEEVAVLEARGGNASPEDPTGAIDEVTGDRLALDPSVYDYWLEEEVSGGG